MLCMFPARSEQDYYKEVNLNEFVPNVSFGDVNHNLFTQIVIFPEFMKKLSKFSGITLNPTSFVRTNIPTAPTWQPNFDMIRAFSTILNEFPKQHTIDVQNMLSFDSFISGAKFFESQNEILYSNDYFDTCINKHQFAIFMIFKNKNNTCYYYISDNIIHVRVNNIYCNGRVVLCDDKTTIINAVITAPNFTERIKTEQSGNTAKLSYVYKAECVNIKYNQVNSFDDKLMTKTTTTFMIKNEMMSFESAHHDISNNEYNKTMVTSCDFTDSSTGLRRRGGFLQRVVNNNQTSIHTIDGKIMRKERDGKIIVDKLNEKKSNKHLIGWKVCKNADGHFRIVKLRIPESAQYLMAIDEEFFMCYRKHRSNLAEVLDIQLPTMNEEISVADSEREAYTCVYTDKSLTYKIDSVISSEYDDNENNGCAKGIHWYKERKYAFRHIPEYHDQIACKHD